MATLALAFLLKGVADTTPPTTVSVGRPSWAWAGSGSGWASSCSATFPCTAQLATSTVVLAVFAADTAAYFTGRLFGRHKLAPRISPGKTWEGFVGGTIAADLRHVRRLYEAAFPG